MLVISASLWVLEKTMTDLHQSIVVIISIAVSVILFYSVYWWCRRSMENHIDDDEDFELEAAPFESLDCTSNYVRECLILLFVHCKFVTQV